MPRTRDMARKVKQVAMEKHKRNATVLEVKEEPVSMAVKEIQRKIDVTMRSGAGTENVYVPPVCWLWPEGQFFLEGVAKNRSWNARSLQETDEAKRMLERAKKNILAAKQKGAAASDPPRIPLQPINNTPGQRPPGQLEAAAQRIADQLEAARQTEAKRVALVKAAEAKRLAIVRAAEAKRLAAQQKEPAKDCSAARIPGRNKIILNVEVLQESVVKRQKLAAIQSLAREHDYL